MNEELYFTKKEFDKLRDCIDEMFIKSGLDKHFNFKKSTYNWSSKNNFRINVETTMSYNSWINDLDPKGKVEVIKKLFDTVSNFIDEDDFSFIGMDSSSGFSYTFKFQPTVLRAKSLLER